MSREDEYVLIELWIKQDQMDKINEEAGEHHTTIYTLIRNMIDFYYKNKRGLNEKTNFYNDIDRNDSF